MAKKSMIMREKKRQILVAKYSSKRQALKKIILSPSSTTEEVMAAQAKLQKLPRDSNRVRLQSRCRLTGRPHAVYKKFGFCRNKLREHSMQGNVPGLVKASW